MSVAAGWGRAGRTIPEVLPAALTQSGGKVAGSRSAAGRAPRAQEWLLAVVAVAYGAAAWVAGRALELGRDEVVYVTQVSRFHDPAYFSAPRSRGITWLVAPAAQLTDSTAAIRAYMCAAAGLGLIAAFWPWLRVRGLPRGAVPTAAALFATLWLSRLYASQVMPNLWVGFAATASTGLAVRIIGRADQRPRWLLVAGWGAGLAVIGIMRPSDLVLVGVVQAALALIVMGVAALPFLLAGAVAALLAVTPWLIEAQQRFGGVLSRLHRSAAIEGGLGGGGSALTMLKVTNGPLLCRPTCRALAAPVPPSAIALWTGITLLTLAAVVWSTRHPQAPTAIALPAMTAVTLGAFYAFALPYGAPRFLLPTFNLLVIPCGAALAALAGAGQATRVRVVVAALGSTAWLGLTIGQQNALAGREHYETSARQVAVLIAADLRAHGVRPGCMVSGHRAPEVAYHLHCDSSATNGHDASLTKTQLLDMAATRQVILLRKPHSPTTTPAWASRFAAAGFRTPTTMNNHPGMHVIAFPPLAAPAQPVTPGPVSTGSGAWSRSR